MWVDLLTERSCFVYVIPWSIHRQRLSHDTHSLNSSLHSSLRSQHHVFENDEGQYTLRYIQHVQNRAWNYNQTIVTQWRKNTAWSWQILLRPRKPAYPSIIIRHTARQSTAHFYFYSPTEFRSTALARCFPRVVELFLGGIELSYGMPIQQPNNSLNTSLNSCAQSHDIMKFCSYIT